MSASCNTSGSLRASASRFWTVSSLVPDFATASADIFCTSHSNSPRGGERGRSSSPHDRGWPGTSSPTGLSKSTSLALEPRRIRRSSQTVRVGSQWQSLSNTGATRVFEESSLPIFLSQQPSVTIRLSVRSVIYCGPRPTNAAGRRCGGSVSPALGLCLAPGPGRRLPGVGVVLRALFEAPAGRLVNRGGRVGRKSLPPAGAAQVRRRSFDGGGGHRVDHQIVRAVWQAGSCVAAVSGLPVGVDSPGDARAAPWTDRALAYFRRRALTEPPVSAPGALPYPPLPAVGDGAAALRRAPDALRGGLAHGVVCVAGADDRVCDSCRSVSRTSSQGARST